MNRKNTILIAVLINVGLLAVLLIAALTVQEEDVPASALLSDAAPFLKQEENPLFKDSVDLAMQPQRMRPASELPISEASKTGEPLPLVQLPIPTPTAAEETLVHKLPPLVTQAPPAPILAAPSVPSVTRSEASFKEIAVKKGDSLEKIAKAHHTTVDELIKMNHLPSSFLKIGQILKIPTERSLATASKPKTAIPLEKETGPEYYTVKVGDNPWTVAMKHQMKVEDLLRLNGLNEEKARKLKAGDRLRIR